MSDSVYKETRKSLGLTRDDVCDKAQSLGKPIQPERLERIENKKFPITPEEVLILSEIYSEPTLWNYYCTHECPIGKDYVRPIKIKDLAQIVLEMLSSLNSMKKSQERLIEITADGIIDDNELKDFIFIQNELCRISDTVQTLQVWVNKMLADGKINLDKYNELKNI